MLIDIQEFLKYELKIHTWNIVFVYYLGRGDIMNIVGVHTQPVSFLPCQLL